MIRDHVPHVSHQNTADLSHFWVVTVLSNPVRYKRRYQLYGHFKDMCEAAGVRLVTVELAFGDRPFMITDAMNPNHLQLRTVEELWHKENMGNLGAQHAARLDPKIKQIAWIDGDLRPMCPARQWFEETWHELQHYQFVQMYESIMNLDSEHNPLNGPSLSFMGSYMRGARATPSITSAGGYVTPGSFWLGSPGGAWAANIDAYNQVGGLIDFCALGSGDWHMAQGLLGILEPGKGETWSPGYSKKLYDWQLRALRWIKKDVGVVKGGITHDHHGPMQFRYYVSRKDILVRHQYDPHTDLKQDHQGLWQLETWDERQINLRDAVRSYFRARMEDVPEYRNWQVREPGK
jgi:hypothetical protein